MSRKKVEIRVIDGEWQWLGWLSDEHLKELCAVADALNTAEDGDE
jgi:hypothetical protein